MRPLDGICVVDASCGPVGGMATMVLADFGADVLKLEPPGGDPLRRLAAAPLWLRGKRSVVADLATAEGSAEALRLALQADVFVTSHTPERARGLGIDCASLRAENPALVHCTISGWGPHGPYAHYPGWDGLVAAKSGRMTSFEGQHPRPGPGFAALPVASHAAAQGAVHGICAALFAREASGQGARVETSLLQAVGLYDLFQLLTVQLQRRGGSREPPVPVGGMPTLNYHPVRTRDGRWIQLGNLLEHLFYAFLDTADLLGELVALERFQGSPAAWTAAATEEARDRILTRMQERDADEWMERFRTNGNVAAEPFCTAQQALDHPDLVANGDVVETEHPKLGAIRQLGPIAQLTVTPGRAGANVPEPGTGEASFPARDAPSQRTAHRAAPEGAPLDGVTIVDFSSIIAGPLASSILADLGARVVKVEPLGGDPYRHLGQHGVLAAKTNAGKESLCVDLKSARGRALVEKLCVRANAVLHNFRPDVPERLGIGYAQLRALREDLVWVAASGYGPDAPSARRPATHPVSGAAMGGALLQAGAAMPPATCSELADVREAARQLMRANEPNPDPNTSVAIASAMLLALLAQRRYGVGQAVYVNMLAANAYANADDFLHYAGKPERPAVDEGLHGYGALYRLYPARSGWVFLAAPDERAWQALCRHAGWEALTADPRFAEPASRRANDAELSDALGQRLRARSAEDWEAMLAPRGVGCVCADAATPGAFFADDPHVAANGFAPKTEHARFGRMQRWGPLVRVDGGLTGYGAGSLAGQHTDALLSELGESPESIQRLREDGVVASEPV